MSIPAISAAGFDSSSVTFGDFLDLSLAAPVAPPEAASQDTLLAGRQQPYEFAFTSAEVRHWMASQTGAKATQELFKGLNVTDKRDQKMVSGLAFLTTFPLPRDVRSDAYGLMADFAKTQQSQRAADAGTPEKAQLDQDLNDARSRAWAFLDTYILPKSQDNVAQPLRPARTFDPPRQSI